MPDFSVGICGVEHIKPADASEKGGCHFASWCKLISRGDVHVPLHFETGGLWALSTSGAGMLPLFDLSFYSALEWTVDIRKNVSSINNEA